MTPPETERVFSLAAAITVNLLLALWLLAPPDQRSPSRPAGDEGATVLVLVLDTPAARRPHARDTPERAAVGGRSTASAAASRRPLSVGRHRGALSVAAADDIQDARDSGSGLLDDTWQSPSGTPAGTGALFEPSVMEARPMRPDPSTRHLDVRLSDRSIMGRFSEMAKAATCRDLARALRESPASSVAILESMQRAGCNTR